MSNLKTYKFSQLYEMSSGISSKPEQAGHGSPFVSFKTVFNNFFLPDNLDEYMDVSENDKITYSVKKGDIFLTRTSESLDELAMSCVADKDYPNTTYSGFLKRLRPTQTDITYDRFMAFYLRSELFRKTMTNNAIMTLRASFNEQIFSYLDLILPDYEKQKKSGDFLFRINQKIKLNNKINAELEAMAKTLYDYWFVQFDFPDVNGKPYKSSGGKMVWNEALKRDIPEGWEVKKISDLAPVITGKQDANFATTNGIYNFFTCGEEVLKCETYEFEGKSILIAGNGNFNVKLYDGKFNAYQRTYILIPEDKKFYTLIYLVIKDRIYSFKNGSRGSIVKFITKGDIENIPIPLPKEAKKDLFDKINSTTSLIEKKIKENQELASLRDWLLPMLMNGQVSVGGYKVEEFELGMVAEADVEYKRN
jgi:type I restriction enzyme S subunit